MINETLRAAAYIDSVATVLTVASKNTFVGGGYGNRPFAADPILWEVRFPAVKEWLTRIYRDVHFGISPLTLEDMTVLFYLLESYGGSRGVNDKQLCQHLPLVIEAFVKNNHRVLFTGRRSGVSLVMETREEKLVLLTKDEDAKKPDRWTLPSYREPENVLKTLRLARHVLSERTSRKIGRHDYIYFGGPDLDKVTVGVISELWEGALSYEEREEAK